MTYSYQEGRAFSKSNTTEKYEGGLVIKSGIGTLTVTNTTTGAYKVNVNDGYVVGSSSDYTETTVTDYQGVTKKFYWKQSITPSMNIAIMMTLLKYESEYWNTVPSNFNQLTNYTASANLIISFNDKNNKTVEKTASLNNSNQVLYDTDLLGLGEISKISIKFNGITLIPKSSTNPYIIWDVEDDKFYMKLGIQYDSNTSNYDKEYDCKTEGTISSSNSWGIDLNMSDFTNKNSFIINLIIYYEDLATY